VNTGAADGNYGGGPLFANYALSASLDGTVYAIPVGGANYSLVPKNDFFGNLRPELGDTTYFDPGAVEYQTQAAATGVTVTPGSFAFGNVRVGFTAAETFSISNGTAATIARPTVTGTGFARTGGTCGAGGIAANATCTYTVTFTPTAATAYSGSLTFGTGVTVNGGTQVTFTGTGVVIITFSGPTPALNTGGTTTKNGVVNVTYSGTTGTFTFTAAPTIAKVGGGSGTFSIQPGGTCIMGKVLAPAGTCTIDVRFVPTNTITRTADVTVTGTATGFATGAYTSATFPAN
jgi:hypothetical protein